MAAFVHGVSSAPTMSERFLTLAEVRTSLKVSRSTIWRWQAERGLRVVKIGEIVRIRERDLQDFLNKHDIAGTDGNTARAEGGESRQLNRAVLPNSSENADQDSR